ncbi:hypothetical protein I2I11_12790 [Pontibacter sp. 172403-2]|uniref:hypothetical protein n=1 Tax=Pontibacter rufus TaxID=2791028 RepID=UPI0018AFBB3E|nr:hypothetical protein [Pontibacter sp. 172403-2]MBF9254174.1 hypothetical protein [Pontibacter sp. 172403-2]
MELIEMISSNIILLITRLLYFIKVRLSSILPQHRITNQTVGTGILLSGILADILRWLGLGPKLQPQPIPVKN